MSGDAEELDSGFETISSSESPAAHAMAGDGPIAPLKQRSGRSALEDTLDDDDIEETLAERLWGLTEMFPDLVRNATSKLISGTVSELAAFDQRRLAFMSTAFCHHADLARSKTLMNPSCFTHRGETVAYFSLKMPENSRVHTFAIVL